MSAFRNPEDFPFVARLEARAEELRTELESLSRDRFEESLDSLTTVSGVYDERGWRYFDLHGAGDFAANRALCPLAAAACEEVPGMVNAGFSLFRPGTHLYPHHGEMPGVLRCHLALIVPTGDQGISAAGEQRSWEPGRCLIFDDKVEHEAWNHGDGDRIVLLVTFRSD